MHHFDALRLLAVKAAMSEDDGAYRFRTICRWYSKTFHTPLHIVEELPVPDILQAYYETSFEEMPEAERQEQLEEMLVTEEEKVARARARDAQAYEDYHFTVLLAEEEKRKQTKAKEKLADVEKTSKVPAFEGAKEAGAPKVSTIPRLEPNISIKFVDADTFEQELEMLGSLVPKDVKQQS